MGFNSGFKGLIRPCDVRWTEDLYTVGSVHFYYWRRRMPTQVVFAEVLLKYRDLDWEYSRTTLNRTPVVRIANYADRLVPSGKYVQNSTKITFPWNYQLADQVQYHVMAFRTSAQAWSEGLDAGTYCSRVQLKQWQTVAHGRGSEGETGEWSG